MIVAGTASLTGDNFFPALVQNLAKALDVSYVVFSERVDNSLQSLRTLALWFIANLADNIEYDFVGTPCQVVVEDKLLCSYPDNLQELFPTVTLLQHINAESYIGVPLLDLNQQVIDNLCIINVKSFHTDERTKVLLSVFTARASAELQRKWAKEEKRHAYQDLEFRV
jgi:hypothetical protein